jgi:hypothetical protein
MIERTPRTSSGSAGSTPNCNRRGPAYFLGRWLERRMFPLIRIGPARRD